MCGFVIYKDQTYGSISHRGSTEKNDSIGGWCIKFHSLPLSSNNTNIEQPISTKYGTLLFNGEIFNYEDLQKKNYPSDLHYLRDCFIRLKGDMVRIQQESVRWDGFWSIALIRPNGNVEFFTDWLGKKQLYYSKEGIASEIKPILPLDFEVMPYTDKSFGQCSTPFREVSRSIPGKLYKYEINLNTAYRSTTNNVNYWDLPSHADVYQIIDRSVKQRMENRLDGVSLLLSGGLDSNIILHHALQSTRDIEIISIYNNEEEALNVSIEHHNVEVKRIAIDKSEQTLSKAMMHYEHPLDYGSLVPGWTLFGNCNNSLVLTGDGSDELFGGYKRSQERDTYEYDMLELMYYHNIRLDRLSMAFTKEARSPLMSMPLARMSRVLPRGKRTNKSILRDIYGTVLPKEIVRQKKVPLRMDSNKELNRDRSINQFKRLCSHLRTR